MVAEDLFKEFLVRRLWKVLLVAGVVAALLGVMGCGTVANKSGSDGNKSAQEILTKAMEAAKTTKATSGKTTFDLSLAMQFDPTNTKASIPEQMTTMFSQPMKLSGQVSWAAQPQAADMTLKAVLSGKTTEMSLRMVNNKVYIGFLGKWYDAGAQATQSIGSLSTAQADSTKIMSKLDPTTWIKNSTVADETVNGKDTYHISGTVDVAALMADLTKLMMDPEFQALGSTLGGLLGDGSTTQTTMSQTDIADAIKTFQVFKIDLWVAKGDYAMVKEGIDLTMAPPAGQDNEGVKSISVKGTVTSSADKFVAVSAPAGALSIDKFLGAIMQDKDTASIMQMLEGLSGSTSSTN